MCPDKPVPILKVVDQTDNPGMARNVYRNIKSLHDKCDILTNSNWYNITKSRYVHGSTNHMFFRLDSSEAMPRINLTEVSYDYDIIVISDYDKGFLTESDIETISKHHGTIFLDTKKVLGPWAKRIEFIKINEHEYARSSGFITKDLEDKIIRTSGEEGCFYRGEQYPVDRSDVIDVSGAGDSFLAGLVVEYSRSENIVDAIHFANKCASEVVKHRGVSII
jgi:D-beta-D-heptose 7-phosphate kinase/D-beta-D-heptose 1-phosphate adenosyltransferase